MHKRVEERIEDIQASLYLQWQDTLLDWQAAQRTENISEPTIKALEVKCETLKNRYEAYSNWRLEEAA